jgi:hypothetical protein
LDCRMRASWNAAESDWERVALTTTDWDDEYCFIEMSLGD